jgi:hypothetical protein
MVSPPVELWHAIKATASETGLVDRGLDLKEQVRRYREPTVR